MTPGNLSIERSTPLKGVHWNFAKFSLVEVPKNWIFFQKLEAAAAEALLRRSEEKLPEFQTSQVGAAVSKSTPTLPETNICPENRPGKGDSYWKPSFLGAMLALGSAPEI